MPTPAKLIAALALIAAAVATVRVATEHAMPDARAVPAAQLVAGSLALLLGWTTVGRAASKAGASRVPVVHVMSTGAAAAVIVAVATLTVAVAWDVMDAALSGMMRDPSRAPSVFLDQLARRGRQVLEPAVVATLLGGGALAGLAAAVGGRMWR
ncbi:TrgA family protein [Jannaschia sp. LMIT008]|uniref:TrgA family protein n=1 Tax=Jannaschia maritima TaxID=3032585 RepID=UPI002811EBD0|nr:TrgA family protein [Jannaschia sp. LMIT008]